MKNFVSAAVLGLSVVACGGGSEVSPTPDETDRNKASTPMLLAKVLADNKVRLTLSGLDAQASRFCIVQDATTPTADAACFTTEPAANQRVQEKTITAPSETTRVTFTAWVLSSTGSVSRHASVRIPGKTCSAAAYASVAGSDLPAVCMITSAGESVLTLEAVKAPISTKNFLLYVNQGFYDQTVFHRFLKMGPQVVQGGSFNYTAGSYVAKASTLPSIVLEAPATTGLSHIAGTMAMARTSELDSATSGFFVNTSNNNTYDGTSARDSSAYAVIGRFVHGAAVWTTLLSSVSNNELDANFNLTSSSPPRWLYWAYQLQ